MTLPAGTYTLSDSTHCTYRIRGNALTFFTSQVPLCINGTVTINGADAKSTIIDGGGLDRVIFVGADGIAQINNVTIQNGAWGGFSFGEIGGGAGINNQGHLGLWNSIVRDNTTDTDLPVTPRAIDGGGIFNGGFSMSLTGCTIERNSAGENALGGAILNSDDSTLVMVNTTVDENGNGGAIVNLGGNLRILHSTISRNTGNGLSTFDISGPAAGVVTMINSTLSGNTGGGVSIGNGSVDFHNVTVTDNHGGGVGLGGSNATFTLRNSILAGNFDHGASSDCEAPAGSGEITSKGYNLIQNVNTCVLISNALGDIIGQHPHVDSLGSNGGPTETHALRAQSPAVDGGDLTGCRWDDENILGTDQRGQQRPIDGNGDGSARCDIGAFEVQAVPTTPTPSLTATAVPTLTSTATPTTAPTATPTAIPSQTLSSTSTAMPSPTTTPTPAPEDCFNCIDDDGNGKIDRADPSCPQPANGANLGLGAATPRAKAVVRCATAVQKAGATFTARRLESLQKCSGVAFICVQRPGDTGCIERATTKCAKLLSVDTVSANARRVHAALSKACAGVSASDLRHAMGLGYDAEDGPCAVVSGPKPTDASTLAACVVSQHSCRAEQLLSFEVPRAAELLTLAGQSPALFPCLPATSNDVGTGLPEVALASVIKCDQGIKKAGSKFVASKLVFVQKCVRGILRCLQERAADPRCLPKARNTCAKLIAKIRTTGSGLEARFATTVLTACTSPDLTLGDMLSGSGLGFDSHTGECAALGIGPLDSPAAIAACIQTQHKCRIEQLLETEVPRLRELLGIGKVNLSE